MFAVIFLLANVIACTLRLLSCSYALVLHLLDVFNEQINDDDDGGGGDDDDDDDDEDDVSSAHYCNCRAEKMTARSCK